MIPIAAGTVVVEGRTDVERLLAGELVYTGALRTNIAAVLSHVPIGGRPCPVTSELFAIAADAHLLRGEPVARAVHVLVPRRSRDLAWARSARGWRGWCAPIPSSSPTVTSRRSPAPSRRRSSPRSRRRLRGWRLAWRPASRWLRSGVGAFLAREAATRCGLDVHPDDGAGFPLAGEGGEVAAAVALSVLGRE